MANRSNPAQVVTLGHAIVDVLAPSPDELVAGLGLEKGTMTLVDDRQAENIYAALGPATEASGGSAANTAASLASLGASVEFVGKVADDGLGKVFTHDIRAAGVRFAVPPAAGRTGPGTGRCLIMVTPDAEKTMCTNLGIGAYLGDADVPLDAVRAAEVVYLEGYLCGKPESASAIEAAISAARTSGTLVAFSGSDPLWIRNNLASLTALIERVDILFANEQEAYLLSDTTTIDAALSALSARCATVAVTLGASGSVVSAGGEVVRVPAAAVQEVVDTTGAGDSFAAGFLYGVVSGLDAEVSARIGALAAAEIVSHMGGRPLVSLAGRAREAGVVQ